MYLAHSARCALIDGRGPECDCINGEVLKRATAGIVAAHEGEMRAYLNGDVAANAWRPEVYARAALTAALNQPRQLLDAKKAPAAHPEGKARHEGQ